MSITNILLYVTLVALLFPLIVESFTGCSLKSSGITTNLKQKHRTTNLQVARSPLTKFIGKIIVRGGSITNPKQAGAVLLMTKLLDCYSDLLTKHPYYTKIISSGVIGALGDTLIQKLENRTSKKPFEYRRLFVFFLVTALYIAPVIHVWFDWLNLIPMPAWANTPVKKAAVMMAVDQTIGAVVITIGFFYAFEFVCYIKTFIR